MSYCQLFFDGIVKNLKFLGADGQILTAGKSGKVPPGQVNGSGNVTEAFRYFYHPDHLGSTSYVTDASGEVYQHLEYFAFGETFVEEHSNTDRTPYLFNGKELDEETGLYYYGARYYEATASVWLSVDPMTEELAGWNPYAYARANPITFIDPDGQWPPAWWQRHGTRIMGGLKVIGGGLEMTAGGAAILTPEPTMVTKAVGVAAVAHGADVVSAGLQQLLTGEDQSSLTSQAMQAAGMSKQTADMVDGGVSIALSGGAGALTNSSKVTNASQLTNITSNAAKRGFTIDSRKFDYFFGKVLSGSSHNVARSAQNLRDLTTLGIRSEGQLMNVFDDALTGGTVVSSKTTEYGVTVMKRVTVGDKGVIDVGFFYSGGNMNSTPSVTTIIPKLFE